MTLLQKVNFQNVRNINPYLFAYESPRVDRVDDL